MTFSKSRVFAYFTFKLGNFTPVNFELNGDEDKIRVGGTEKVCNSNHCGESYSCGGETYYCIYDSSKGWHWSTSKPSGFCCSDDDCSGYDPDTHTKIVCDCPDHTKCSHPSTDDDYTCKALKSCSDNSDCHPNYCCDTITGSRECKPEGTIINYGGKSYLCDPPYGFATGESEINNPIKEQKVEVTNLIDMIFRIFSKILS